MATKTVIRQGTDLALTTLNESLARLGVTAGVEVPNVKGIVFRRDPHYQEMLRWQALADAAAQIADRLGAAEVSFPELPERTTQAGKPTRAVKSKSSKKKAETEPPAETSLVAPVESADPSED